MPLDDFERRSRLRVAKVLRGVGSGRADPGCTPEETITPPLKARFVAFTKAHLDDDFFTADAPAEERALRPSDLDRALANAYAIRSRYAHGLEVLNHRLADPQIARGEVFGWYGDAYATYSGLARVLEHVVGGLVRALEGLPQEDLNWRDYAPGIENMRAAPQYWLWNTKGYTPRKAKSYLSGSISWAWNYSYKAEEVPDHRPVQEEIVKQWNQASREEQQAMLNFVRLAQAVMPAGAKVEAADDLVAKNQDLLDKQDIGCLATSLLAGHDVQGPPRDALRTIRGFWTSRHHKGALELPRGLDVAVLVWVGNAMLSEEPAEARAVHKEAVRELAGYPEAQDLVRETMEATREVDLKRLTDILRGVERPDTADEEE